MQALLRWISPVLSFTAEEAWLLMEEGEDSVHLLEWFEGWNDFGELKIYCSGVVSGKVASSDTTQSSV